MPPRLQRDSNTKPAPRLKGYFKGGNPMEGTFGTPLLCGGRLLIEPRRVGERGAMSRCFGPLVETSAHISGRKPFNRFPPCWVCNSWTRVKVTHEMTNRHHVSTHADICCRWEYSEIRPAQQLCSFVHGLSPILIQLYAACHLIISVLS